MALDSGKRLIYDCPRGENAGVFEAATVTQRLAGWSRGDRASLDALTPLVYRELHRLAAGYLRREQAGHTLQPAALIHEAYLRIVDQTLPDFNSRSHFFGVATHYMRQILVDRARTRRAEKRGGGERPAQLEEEAGRVLESPEDLLALDGALTALAALDERKARIVELPYLGSLTPPETAELMGVSLSTVSRELRSAEAWLKREIAGS